MPGTASRASLAGWAPRPNGGELWTPRDPGSFVRFLERTSTGPGDQAPGLDLLELHEGDRCLDVGCGLGEDARAIAEATGSVVLGVDQSARLASEATRRSAGNRAVSFAVGDGAALPLHDSIFDAAAIKRTLMHLPEPGPVIREMARVARPGGRVVAIEPDCEVLLLDSGLMDVTRRILAFRAASYANPWSGRRLRGLLRAAGLVDMRAEVHARDLPTLEFAESRIHLIGVARAAAERGVISGAEADAWESDLTERDLRGAFTCVLLMSLPRGECRPHSEDRTAGPSMGGAPADLPGASHTSIRFRTPVMQPASQRDVDLLGRAAN
jgi:SAM-dependent methyltransferase